MCDFLLFVIGVEPVLRRLFLLQSRKAAMEMLIENARTTGDEHGTQFIYLTPHDVRYAAGVHCRLCFILSVR